MEWLAGLGPFAVLIVFAAYIIWKEFSQKQEKTNNGALEGKVDIILSTITELHGWHNKEDEDGVKIWYIR